MHRLQSQSRGCATRFGKAAEFGVPTIPMIGMVSVKERTVQYWHWQGSRRTAKSQGTVRSVTRSLRDTVRENKNIDPQLWPSAAPSGNPEGHWRIQGQLRRKSIHWHGGMEETAPPRTSDQYPMLLRGIPCLLSRFPCDSDSWRRSSQVCTSRNFLHWERGDGW